MLYLLFGFMFCHSIPAQWNTPFFFFFLHIFLFIFYSIVFYFSSTKSK